MDPALLEPATVVASLVAVAWAGRRLAAWLHAPEDRPRFRFPDGTTHPARAETRRAPQTTREFAQLYGRSGVSGTALRYREYARRFEPDPALANDPEVVAVRQEIAAIDAAREIDEPTPEPAPAGAGATWTPLRERPAGRWVED